MDQNEAEAAIAEMAARINADPSIPLSVVDVQTWLADNSPDNSANTISKMVAKQYKSGVLTYDISDAIMNALVRYFIHHVEKFGGRTLTMSRDL